MERFQKLEPTYAQMEALESYSMCCNDRMKSAFFRFMINFRPLESLAKLPKVSSRYDKEKIVRLFGEWLKYYYIYFNGDKIIVMDLIDNRISNSF